MYELRGPKKIRQVEEKNNSMSYGALKIQVQHVLDIDIKIKNDIIVSKNVLLLSIHAANKRWLTSAYDWATNYNWVN